MSATAPPRAIPPYSGSAPLISLPHTNYDIVGSIVLYNPSPEEVARAIRQFYDIPHTDSSKHHVCVIDNSPRPLSTPLCSDARIRIRDPLLARTEGPALLCGPRSRDIMQLDITRKDVPPPLPKRYCY